MGIVVSNMDLMSDFVQQGLGLQLVADVLEGQSFIRGLLPGAATPLRTKKYVDRSGFTLELLHFSNTSSPSWLGHYASTGLTHIALSVESMEVTRKKLKIWNLDFLSEPQISVDRRFLVAYCIGPERLHLELVESLDVNNPSHN